MWMHSHAHAHTQSDWNHPHACIHCLLLSGPALLALTVLSSLQIACNLVGDWREGLGGGVSVGAEGPLWVPLGPSARHTPPHVALDTSLAVLCFDWTKSPAVANILVHRHEHKRQPSTRLDRWETLHARTIKNWIPPLEWSWNPTDRIYCMAHIACGA